MDILVVLLNYRRPANLRRLISELRNQTAGVRIALWNNGPAADSGEFPEVEHYFQSPENLMCIIRWHVASVLAREYVCIMDDDLAPSDPELFGRCVEKCREYRNERIIGCWGRALTRGPLYYSLSQNVSPADDSASGDRFADIVKGRFMFMHRDLLTGLRLNYPFYDGRGDDIIVSLASAREPRFHVIPRFMAGALVDLPSDAEGLRAGAQHYEKRNLVVDELVRSGDVPWLAGGTGGVLAPVARVPLLRRAAVGLIEHVRAARGRRRKRTKP